MLVNDLGLLYDRSFAEHFRVETLVIVEYQQLNLTQILFLLVEVRNALCIDSVSDTKVFIVDVVAWSEEHFEPLVLFVDLPTIEIDWIVILPVEAHEAALRVGSSGLERTGRETRDRIELIIVGVGALVER